MDNANSLGFLFLGDGVDGGRELWLLVYSVAVIVIFLLILVLILFGLLRSTSSNCFLIQWRDRPTLLNVNLIALVHPNLHLFVVRDLSSFFGHEGHLRAIVALLSCSASRRVNDLLNASSDVITSGVLIRPQIR